MASAGIVAVERGKRRCTLDGISGKSAHWAGSGSSAEESGSRTNFHLYYKQTKDGRPEGLALIQRRQEHDADLPRPLVQNISTRPVTPVGYFHLGG